MFDDLRRGFTEDFQGLTELKGLSKIASPKTYKNIPPPQQQLGPLLDLTAVAAGKKNLNHYP